MKIIVVDDEKNIRESIAKYLSMENFNVSTAANGLSGERLIMDEIFDLAVVDLKMPGKDGLELLKSIRQSGIEIPVIMISAFGEISDAVNAMKLGADDYIVKPFDPDHLIEKINILLEKYSVKRSAEKGKSSSLHEFIGESELVKDVKTLIEKVAPATSNVLITGESGTGKEVAANLIHKYSGRDKDKFIAVNVSGIPASLLESELFGYEKGAFTGADRRKTGLFERADGGTLFLDEIGDMPFELQVKLLRVLQERKIMRVGGTENLPVDVRIISATNKNLEDEVKSGNFREDLYFRLNVVNIKLPSLRERSDDIVLLAGFFIRRYNDVMGKSVKYIDEEALRVLKGYSFPGNVRELENIIERAFIFCENDIIRRKDISISDEKTSENESLSQGTIKDIEKNAIINALRRWDGNRTKASEELGITRRTIINKISEYGIDI